MNFHYAQIDLESKICFADSLLSGIVDKPDMILIPEGDTNSYLGKIYNNGIWIDPPEQEVIEDIDPTS